MKEGFMEIVTNIDSKMQKEFCSNLLWLGVINLIIGAVLFFYGCVDISIFGQ